MSVCCVVCVCVYTLCVPVVCVHMHMCACMRVSVCSIIMCVYMHEHTLVSIRAFGCADVSLDMPCNHHTPPFLILNLFEQTALLGVYCTHVVLSPHEALHLIFR